MRSLAADSGPPTAPILSAILAAGCALLAIVLPAIALYIALQNPQVIIDGLHLQVPPDAESLSIAQRVCITVVAAIPPLCQAYGLLSARRCFRNFARRQYFTVDVVRGLRGFAAGLFFWPVTAVLSKPLLTLVATLGNGSGGREVSVGLGTEQVFMLLFAGILWQISGVMTRATRLAEENAQFV